MIIESEILKSRRAVVIIALTFILTVTLQDLLLSVRNGYSFYLSESLLFNTFWIWFFPIAYLGSIYPKFIQKKLKNWALYICFLSLVHWLVYSISVSILAFLFFKGDYNFGKMLNYSVSNDFYKYFIGYSIAYLLNKETGKLKLTDFTYVRIGTTQNKIRIPTDTISHITAEAPYIAVFSEGQKHLSSETLKSITANLPPSGFVRIHKSTILNIKYVMQLRSRLNGDYDVALSDRTVLRLSRNYVSDFKKLYHASS